MPRKAKSDRQMQAWAGALIRWFCVHARDLPWRHTLDPYAIWISEVMLQQTQVKTVIPYWSRWMRHLPDVPALARARPAKVLKLWEGLGYYSRARNLQKAAQQILREHAGRFPTDFAAVLALPGIGRYTAGAIASIAFNQPKPILDGNVIRVLTRVFGITGNARARPTLDKLWELAGQLVQSVERDLPPPGPEHTSLAAGSAWRSSGSCSLLNQALMELGATICSPRQPQCQACPLQHDCAARASGRPEELPRLARRPAATARYFQAFLLEHDRKWLVVQRPADVINAQLWEFPNLEVRTGTDPATSARQLLGVSPLELTPFHTLQHSITRYRISLAAYRAQASERPNLPAVPETGARWLALRELQRLPFSSAHRQLLRRLQAGHRSCSV